MNRFTAELLGTFFLCLLALLGEPMGVCLGLAALIWALGPVSGGHFNPAVSFSQRVHGAITTGWSLAYVLAQFLAATLAAILAALLGGYDAEQADAAPLGIPDGWMSALTGECLGTLLLALVILGVANARRNAGTAFAGLAIGGTVFAAGTALGSPFLNPAVTWASGLRDLFSALAAEEGVGSAFSAELVRFGKFLPWAACLALAQLTGALLAAGCFRLTHPEDCGGTAAN